MNEMRNRYQERAIRNRVISCIPATQYAFDTLLRLLDVTVTESIPTAAVRCGIAPALLVNPAFVAEHCRSDEALFMLVMHELHHVLFGHTRLFPRATRAQNFAFDAVINAYLCEMFPEPEHTAFFRSYYPADAFPWFLLRPPGGWPRNPIWTPPGLSGVSMRLISLHKSLYTTTGVTYEEIFAALAEALDGTGGEQNADGEGEAGAEEAEEKEDGPVLLGDHEAGGENDSGTQREDRQVLAAAIRAIFEKWPAPKEHRRGRSLNEALILSLIHI